MTMIHARFRSHLRPLARLLITGAAATGLVVGATGLAAGRFLGPLHPDAALVRSMDLGAGEAERVRLRASGFARALDIPGEAGVPRRRFEALGRAVIDEVAVLRPDGRPVAVVRMDADRDALRSVVRIGWSTDDDTPRVDRSAAPSRASAYARAAGISAPPAEPAAAWDETTRAWRVTWPRSIDGVPAPGEGLTVWVYPGGRLAALRRIETPVASAPPLRIPQGAAVEAALAWARTAGIASASIAVSGAPELIWATPDDFAVDGGAEVTEARLHLAWSVTLTVRPAVGDTRQVMLLVDAGSGVVMGGSETA